MKRMAKKHLGMRRSTGVSNNKFTTAESMITLKEAALSMANAILDSPIVVLRSSVEAEVSSFVDRYPFGGTSSEINQFHEDVRDRMDELGDPEFANLVGPKVKEI